MQRAANSARIARSGLLGLSVLVLSSFNALGAAGAEELTDGVPAKSGGVQKGEVSITDGPISVPSLSNPALTGPAIKTSPSIQASPSLQLADPGSTKPGGISSDPGVVAPALLEAPKSLNPASGPRALTMKDVQFFSPEQPLEVPTAFGILHVQPGSLVLMINGEDALTVYDLHDGSSHAVYLTADNQKFPLMPGKFVTLAKPGATNFAAVNKLPFVAYLSADYKVVSAELVSFHGAYDVFSLCRLQQFKALLNSSDAKTRRVAENVLKTAAIMNQLAANAKYYNFKQAPASTPSAK